MFKSIFAFRNAPQCSVTYLYLIQVISYLKKLGVTLEDKVIIAQDFGSWRKEIDPLYKAQRKAAREAQEDKDFWDEMFKEFNEYFPKLEVSLPWHFIKIYKIESDDIASCAVRFIDAEEKILVSTDEDWQMLCTLPNVKIFSPYSKKFKIIKNPEKILLKKIHGDISDNLLTVPKTEAEWEKRKTIVDLINLPQHIEAIIRPVIESLPIKNLYLNKVPSRYCANQLKKLYNLED
jgi:hypothetical protein